MKKNFYWQHLITCFLLLASVAVASAETPKNIIFMIGDGKGFEQDKAASIYWYGYAGALNYESLPYYGEVLTYAADSAITDSAAAATAIATGHKVNNGVLSVALPGNGSELQTLLEYFKSQGKMTGLVTTTPITNATPAGFGAHENSRNNLTQIAQDILGQTRPNVIFGAGGDGMTISAAQTAGYTVVTTRSTLQSLDTESATRVSGQFGTGQLPYEYDGSYATMPHLREMTATALAILDNDPDGFFVMIEGGTIDWAGHANHLMRNIYETREFENAVQITLNWIASQANPQETLLIVTADHETGGLQVLQNNGINQWPSVSWSTTGHTATNVPVYAQGENANFFFWTIDNTDFFELITCPSKPVRILERSLYFDSIQAAYNAAFDSETIQAMTAIVTENVDFNRTITVTFQGGHDCYYADNVNMTVLRGNSTVSNGTMLMENFYLE